MNLHKPNKLLFFRISYRESTRTLFLEIQFQGKVENFLQVSLKQNTLVHSQGFLRAHKKNKTDLLPQDQIKALNL